jgi:hypothetical protein
MKTDMGSMVQSFFGNYKYKKLFKSQSYLPTLRIYSLGLECEGFSVSDRTAFPNPEEDFYGSEQIAIRDLEDVKSYLFDDVECVRIAYKSRGLNPGRKYICVPGIKNSEVVVDTILLQIEKFSRRSA